MRNKDKKEKFEKYNPIEFGLTPDQKMFVDEFLMCLDKMKVAHKMRPGRSRKSVYYFAKRMMDNPNVQKAIDHHMNKRATKLDIKSEMIVEELARIAFQDIRNVVSFDENGVKFKNSEELDEDAARSISEISETVTQHGGTKKVKMYDKLSALELLGRHMGMWKDKIEHSGGVVILDGSRKRDG